jgi:HTH-type transcriptional regulator/antitoxin HipB
MEFPIKILNQLRPILRGFRKAQKLTQADIAKRLGITQQSYAQLEANPAAASLERLFKVLAILQVDVVLKEREVAEKLVTIPMIDTVKNQSIPSETKAISMGQLGSDRSQVYPNTMNFAAQQLAMGSIRNIPSARTLADMDMGASMNRVVLEQLQGHSAADSLKRDFLEKSKAFAEVAGLTAINRADLDIAKACSASADITAMNRIALEQLGGYSATDSCKTALEQLQGHSAADSLKRDFLEQSKVFAEVAGLTAMNRADLDIAKACSATADITAMNRVGLEQLQGYSTADSFKTALEQLQGYSAADSLKTDLEQLRGYSTADSLKTALEQSKAFTDMTNELSLAFSSVKKKR